ncbi:UNVERIFIED_CONTAM: O-fucosyltransferase 30 [Sesamum latifolium]|uniref:O-fucosyltransferase 30 n=1 Tax=Sesamum latifolium TaxID=2727402 RepID=A0AAW2XFF4_9LAMI
MDFPLPYSSRGTRKWKRRPTLGRTPLIVAFFIIVALFISSKALISPSVLPISRDSRPLPSQPCPTTVGGPGGKFLWHAPHSGFSNQLSEFKNAILMAAVLNRTLIVPPILDHHAVALGSCPKFRVLDPNELRFKVWNHSIELFRDRRQVHIYGRYHDLSSLVSAVRFIDFRAFVSMWCGVNLNLGCVAYLHPKKIVEILYGHTKQMMMEFWIHSKLMMNSKKKRKISFLRRRKDVYKALGPGSAAGTATVLALGSLFTSSYKGSESHIDIHEAPQDQRIQLLIQKIEFLPFVAEILSAGKKFALETIKAPFLCAQLRLLDGQFKNHWKGTFLGLKQKLDLLKQNGSLPVHVFVMTDLPQLNWTGTYLGDLAKDFDAFKLFVLREEDELVAETTTELLNAGNAMKLQSGSSNFEGRDQQCDALSLPDIRLFVEETICSCASLGFVGTAGSTIAESRIDEKK